MLVGPFERYDMINVEVIIVGIVVVVFACVLAFSSIEILSNESIVLF